MRRPLLHRTALALALVFAVTAMAAPDPPGRSFIEYTDQHGQQRTASYFRPLLVVTPRLHGPDVLELQRRLVQRLPAARSLKIDGFYGPATAAAIRRYQAAHHLRPTGVVTFDTWAVLFDVGE